MKKKTPPRLGTVWTATARIQIIAGTKWKTLATCMDTPNQIKETIETLEADGHKLGTLWVNGEASGRFLALDKKEMFK